MSNVRSWIFRGLVAIGIGGFVTAWILPWWGVYIQALGHDDKVRIYPYGLWNNLGGWGGFMGNAGDMPWFFTPLMWVYFGLVIIALLFAVWKMDKSIRLFGRKFNLSKLLVGIVGFSVVVIILTFYLYAKARVESLGVDFIGQSYVERDVMIHTYAYSGLRIGVWIACGVAPYLMLLALLRNIIAGRPKEIAD